jgi:neutral ceramidase
VFVDLGLAIKRASPFRTTLVVELCNCVETIYVPTRVAHAGGSYEVTNSTVQPGAGELLAETAVQLLRDAAPPLDP